MSTRLASWGEHDAMQQDPKVGSEGRRLKHVCESAARQAICCSPALGCIMSWGSARCRADPRWISSFWCIDCGDTAIDERTGVRSRSMIPDRYRYPATTEAMISRPNRIRIQRGRVKIGLEIVCSPCQLTRTKNAPELDPTSERSHGHTGCGLTSCYYHDMDLSHA